MARRIREHDWAKTALGDVKGWPIELKSAVALLIESRFPGAIVWGPAMTTIYNDAFLPILGEKQNTLGRSFAEIWSEVWSGIEPHLVKAYSGHAVFIENFELLVQRSSKPSLAYFTFCYSPLRLADGSVGGIVDTIIETTDIITAQHERKLLSAELSHRLKNTVSVVQAIARQTFKDVKEREAVDAFDRRLSALGKAHEVLTRESWTSASMRSVVASTLFAISNPGRFDISGCDVHLGPKTVVSLSLLLHELTTNASKYGALSTEKGRVSIHCDVDDDKMTMVWKEHGGPPVILASKRGFGSRIIQMGLGGKTTVHFEPDGLKVHIEAHLRELQTH
jgi:two-component sensor histidine kinase